MDGVFLFNKPVLWTSHDAVDFVRRVSGQRSVGHAGTLDPMATGLLVLLLGKATKLSASLSGLDKDYRGSITLGLATDSLDLEGRVVSTGDCSSVNAEAVERVIRDIAGMTHQAPPAYSAVHKEGKRLYEWARKGGPVTVEARPIQISELKLEAFHTPEVHFFIRCSKGTYVRCIAEELGTRLGCGAVLSSLVRTRVGGFTLDRAIGEAATTRAEIQKRLFFP